MRLMIVAAFFLMAACTPSTYTAHEYPVDNAEVTSFDVKGEVSVSNGYAAGEAKTVPVWDNKIPADLDQVTSVFADQLEQEIRENGDRVGTGPTKTISARVTNIYARNRFAYVEGNITVELKLGNGDTVTVKNMNGSPAGMKKSLDGVINKAVIEVMANDAVQAYLAQ